MTNKVLRKKSHCIVCRSNKSRFLKQKIKLTTDFIKKMNTYRVKCKKDTEKINLKMFGTKNSGLIMPSKCPACGI